MVRAGQVVWVSLGLIGAGIIFGATAGGTAFALVALTAGEGFSSDAFAIGAVVGAPLGAITAPLLSWVLLRRVPLGRMFVVCSLGATIGGFIGWYTITRSDDLLLQPIAGALLGCVVAATALSYRSRVRPGNAAPKPS